MKKPTDTIPWDLKPASATDTSGVDLKTPSPNSYKDWNLLDATSGVVDDPDAGTAWVKRTGGSTSIFTSL
jgi:hypothetical protein